MGHTSVTTMQQHDRRGGGRAWSVWERLNLFSWWR